MRGKKEKKKDERGKGRKEKEKGRKNLGIRKLMGSTQSCSLTSDKQVALKY